MCRECGRTSRDALDESFERKSVRSSVEARAHITTRDGVVPTVRDRDVVPEARGRVALARAGFHERSPARARLADADVARCASGPRMGHFFQNRDRNLRALEGTFESTFFFSKSRDRSNTVCPIDYTCNN